MSNINFTFIQDQIGYEFKNENLLQQAFVRRSYSEENGGRNNEVLEFIGDKVLDFIVIKILAEKYGHMTGTCEEEFDEFVSKKNESELTELKKELVQKNTLAERIDILGLSDFLIMGKGDIQNKAYNEKSVKEDLFEAILGAIALDCNWNIETLQNAVDIMLCPDSILDEGNSIDYVSLIQEWSYVKTGAIPLYHFEKGDYQITFYIPFDGISQRPKSILDQEIYKTKWHCLLKLSDDLKVFRGFGQTQAEARKNVCKLAYDHLCENGLWLSIRDEIDDPNENDAISQLEILARRGYFSVPQYEFVQSHDTNGNPIWKSTCRIPEEEKTFFFEASSKKEAKKASAYKMLLYVLNTYDDDSN